MQFDRSDFMELLAKEANKSNGQSVDPKRLFAQLQQASLKSDYLTGNEHWDYFLSLLQNTKSEYEQLRDQCRMALENPATTDTDYIASWRQQLLLCNERISTLDAVMKLPKDLHEVGEKAKLQIEKLAAEQEQGTTNS